ncbi:MAG: Chondramide synthase cmdD [Syntrophorhabdus sp. PtaU1.Bin153]|nr:MAG: Chondramide synthase cmdD [Syntrophorhabdus sp. PtaU1.Bin153]
MADNKQERVKLWDEVPGFDLLEEIDIPEKHSWFLDGTHCIPPWTPLFGWFWIKYCSHGLKTACSELSIPTCKGWEMRFRDGGSYNALNIVRDQKEIASREKRFREALRPWLEDFDGLWNGHKAELLSLYGPLKEFNIETASNLRLHHHLRDLVNVYARMWEIHFVGMYASYNAWLLLEELCKERFGISDQDTQFQDMVRGFDNKVYQTDKRLWEFAQLALDMGLKDIFTEKKAPEIEPGLRGTQKGQEWLAQFMRWMETDEVGGWRMQRMNELTEPYWMEDVSIPLGIVKHFVDKGRSYVLEDLRKGLIEKREIVVASLLDKISPHEKDLFEGLIRLAGKSSSYSEEHNLYCELYMHAILRRGCLAIGRRIAEAGTVDEPGDVFFLNPDEIDRVILVPEAHDLRFIARRRKAAWQIWQKRANPPIFTDRASLEEAAEKDLLPSRDAIAIKIVMGELPKVQPEAGADLSGLCASSGEAEGPARVVSTFDDLKNVRPGEVLVCPGSSPAWTPVFGIVKGVVADSGGILSHAAIIGREYEVPTVVNTSEGTSKIRTGQRIRVDANNCAVYILDKEK